MTCMVEGGLENCFWLQKYEHTYMFSSGNLVSKFDFFSCSADGQVRAPELRMKAENMEL